MKFCKNLQKVIDISDPAWAPFWLNYKSLKKLIKDLLAVDEINRARGDGDEDSDYSSPDESSPASNGKKRKQQGGDVTVEGAAKRPRQGTTQQSSSTTGSTAGQNLNQDTTTSMPSPLGQNPGEVAFFQSLHAELKKAQFFFAKVTKEFSIREERMRRGLVVVKGLNQSSMNEKWRTMSNALYLLYKDLLLLETYAILTYVGFSKILKKHDKVTGYRTCNTYMESIVNKANFTHYPKLMSMISSCDDMFERISEALEQEGKKLLSEDEQLFIGMIQRLNVEVLGDDKKNGSSTRLSPRLQPVVSDSPEVGDLRELLSKEGSNGIIAEEEEDDDDNNDNSSQETDTKMPADA